MKPKKPTKVYLQYPWKFPDSPYYKYLIDNPPEGIEYLNAKKQKGVITNKRFFWMSNFLKRNIRRIFNTLYLSVPNSHKSPKGNYDLIHCAHCLSKNADKPWVADFEGVFQMSIGRKNNYSKNKIIKILLKKNCKKIIAWTEDSAKQIIEDFPGIKKKVEVVYPAVPLPNIKRKKHKEINLLFVGRYFYAKGGLHALEVMDRLTRKHENVRGIIVSEVPREILQKYSKNKKIRFYNLIPQEKLFKEIMPSSDILIYPGYSDSFGFILLEAMSFGIPIVTVDKNGRKEIVEEGKTGFVEDRPKIKWKKGLPYLEKNSVVDDMLDQSEKLIKNKNLRERLSKNCIETVKKGKFSVKERNKKLGRVYGDVLK